MQVHVIEEARFPTMFQLQKKDAERRGDPKQMAPKPCGETTELRADLQGQGAVSLGDLLGPCPGDHGEDRPVEDIRHLSESVPHDRVGEVKPTVNPPRSLRGRGRWDQRDQPRDAGEDAPRHWRNGAR